MSSTPTIKSFRVKVTFRLAAICLFGSLTVYLFFNSAYWMSGIWTALATAALFYESVNFVSHSEIKLISFLQSLKQNDFSLTFPENVASSDYVLHSAFNQLNEIFKNLRSERESQHQMLQVIVEHAAVPLICFEEHNDEVYLINNAAKNLFQIPFLQKIDALWRLDRNLPDFIRDVQDGDKASLKITINNKSLFLSITSRHLIFKEKNLKLIALTDVSSELAAKEAEAWQKLLRVLTHEISNSAIPLSTLSSYVCEIVHKSEQENRMLTAEERVDVLESLDTIEKRSLSLKEFVTNFKNVNQIAEPVTSNVSIDEILDEVIRLFAQEFAKENIVVEKRKIGQTVIADRNLTIQVLINVIKNAIESMSNFKAGKVIKIDAHKDGNRFVDIKVSDTGCGIAPEDIDQIFVPFYSTKRSGSGIGLSVCQQIMQKQKGNITVQSTPGRGSVFTLSFVC